MFSGTLLLKILAALLVLFLFKIQRNGVFVLTLFLATYFGLIIVYHIMLISHMLPGYNEFIKFVFFCLTICYITSLFIHERWFLLSLLFCSRIEKGQTITFNPEAFVRTRKNMQPFLRKILQSQIFQQVRNMSIRIILFLFRLTNRLLTFWFC